MTDMERTQPPWNQEQVDALNAFQHAGMFHPFTCGLDHTNPEHLDGEGVLLATKDGWVCPYCPYRQGWAWKFMLE